jgi:choline dehydrogenase-like flavoprotein
MFENQNGRMMESGGGASILDVRTRDGCRQSVFRSYVFPCLDAPNLTVLTDALVTRVTFDRHERNRVTGVEFSHDGTIHRVGAGCEVVLSLGAIHTPKVLMQSGIGPQAELLRHGIPVVQHLAGVGENLQDHPAFACVWEYQQPLPSRNNGCGATYFWKSDPSLDTPDNSGKALSHPDCNSMWRNRFGLIIYIMSAYTVPCKVIRLPITLGSLRSCQSCMCWICDELRDPTIRSAVPQAGSGRRAGQQGRAV